MDLQETREELDKLNEKIVDVIEERMELVVDVAKYKERKGKDIVDEDREEEVKQEFEDIFQERGLPEGRGRDLAEYLIATAIDREEEILDREIDR